MPDHVIESKAHRKLQFAQIAVAGSEEMDTVFGLDRNGYVWYYCWREKAWFPLEMVKGREEEVE